MRPGIVDSEEFQVSQRSFPLKSKAASLRGAGDLAVICPKKLGMTVYCDKEVDPCVPVKIER